MARKSQLELELDRYAPFVEGSFITPKFEYTGSDLMWTTKEEKVLAVSYNAYRNIAYRIINSLPNYHPSYVTRENAIRNRAVKTKDAVLSKLNSINENTKGAKRSNSKVQDFEF